MTPDQVFDMAHKEAKMLHAIKPFIDDIKNNPEYYLQVILIQKKRIEELEGTQK